MTLTNPYYKALAELRRRIITAGADHEELAAAVATAIGKVAGQAVQTHNPALLATAFAFAARHCELRGLDVAEVRPRLEKKWGACPVAAAWCSACGRAYVAHEMAGAWVLTEVTWAVGIWELVATCSTECTSELYKAGQPGYASFVSSEALQDFARARGHEKNLPGPGRTAKLRELDRPS